MNFKLVIISSLILSSCSTVALEEKNAFDLDSLDENRKFELFLSDDWEKYLSNNPLFATYTGDKRQNNKINPNTVDHFFQELESDKTSLAGLYEIDFNKLNDENKLNYKLKEFSLNESINSKKFPTYYLRLNQRGGIQSFYETGNRLVYSSSQDYFDWLERLEEFTNHINISLKINKEGLSKGITQPKMITKGVIEQIDAIIDSNIDTNPYMKVFLEADESILTKSEKKDLIDNAKNLIENKINPAYVELNKFLKNDYIVNSRNSIGIKDVPGGSEYYEDLAKHFTTTNLTPDEIHEIGLTEIKRIRSEMEAIIDQVNWDGDFNSFLNYLRTSPRFYYDNGEDLLDAYLIMSKTIDPLLPKLFTVFPRAPYGVIPIPAESAPFTTTAYYNSPSPGRPGYFYANLYKPESRPKYEIPVLTVHEAVPGHHFQI